MAARAVAELRARDPAGKNGSGTRTAAMAP